MSKSTIATKAFKAQISVMAEYLRAAGYEISTSHLNEAAARLRGAANWRTYRAELQSMTDEPTYELEADAEIEAAAPEAPAAYVSDLEGQSVVIYLDVFGPGGLDQPVGFCKQTVDQAWLNTLHGFKDACWQSQQGEVVVDGLGIDWLGMPAAEGIFKNLTMVSREGFMLLGVTADGEVATGTARVSIKTLEDLVVKALLDGQKEVFLVAEAARRSIKLAGLGRSPASGGFDA